MDERVGNENNPLGGTKDFGVEVNVLYKSESVLELNTES